MPKLVTLPTRFAVTFSSLAILLFAANIFLPTHAFAATSGSWWNAGHIIDDQVFYNKDAMSVAQIQQFLNAKVSQCDNSGAEQYAGTGKTVYQYFHPLGYKFPVTCLKDYYENTSNNQNNLTQNDGQAAPIPAGAISSAQIVWNAAQQYSINPEVLIVIIQRESGLITDDSPLSIQYQAAAGYNCPDSGPNHSIVCSGYQGFYNQVENAAWQLRAYANNPNNYNYVTGDNNILWSPQPSCGSKVVHIVNQATASLYDYTPYQPNQAALDNLYGTGDSCSAYANRNFWRYFYDWFGSPLVSFVWQNQGYAVLEQGGTTPIDQTKLIPGRMYVVKLTALNTGTAVWNNNGPTPFTLATADPTSRLSLLCAPSWLACNRPTFLQESSVMPGQSGHFTFTFQAPISLGSYTEYFKPVAEFLAWSNDTSQPLNITVNPGTYSWSNQGYRIMDQSQTNYLDPGNLKTGQNYVAILTATNTGTATWTNSGPVPVTLAPDNPAGHSSFLCNPSWLTCNRVAYLQEASVAPGQTGHFTFTFQAPQLPGGYREYFRPLSEFIDWMNGDTSSLGIVVNAGTFMWQSPAVTVSDSTDSHSVDPSQFEAGKKYTVHIAAVNSGTATWTNGGATPVTLAPANPNGHNSYLCDSGWLTCNRVAYLQEASVAPGQTGHFTFTFQAPNKAGAYHEFFEPVAEFASWFNASTTLEMVVH
ncbi:MAG TPA: hypothetical protein VNG90_00410 [Candidatus Acidoferrum sp.]|nr:hypothetical protein [Candidatus Acidoferrum sp.]